MAPWLFLIIVTLKYQFLLAKEQFNKDFSFKTSMQGVERDCISSGMHGFERVCILYVIHSRKA